MLPYKEIDILTSEQARFGKKSIVDAVLEFVQKLKIAARCFVTRGIAGVYENGEMATGRLEVLSYNLPIRISIVLPAAEAERVLDGVQSMVTEGIVILQDLNVISHTTRNALFPRQILVRDAMTPQPKYVTADSSLSEAAGLLLASIFTGMPVVDENKRPIGVVTQGDLIRKGGLPLRLGLLAESDQNRLETVLMQLSSRQVTEVMTTPAVMIAADRPLSEAVEFMLIKGVKRLPVVDGNGRLVGMLSRLDIFRTIMREAPDWNAFKAQKIEVKQLKRVGDILRRDVHVVSPETSVGEVIRLIDDNDIQRVAVVDADQRLLGMISDRDLMRYFKPAKEGIWSLLTKSKQPFQPDACQKGDLKRCLAETTADAIMTTVLVTAREDMLIEEAIALMIDKGLKRLPVIDAEGRFKGMISRDSLLRTGFSGLT